MSNRPMDNRAIRRINLLVLIEETPDRTIAQLAEICRANAAHLSQVGLNERGMGARLARRLEAGMKKPTGWMDIPHSKNGKSVLSEEPTPEEWLLLGAYRLCPRETKETIFALCQQFAKKA